MSGKERKRERKRQNDVTKCSTKQRIVEPLLSGLMQRNPCFTFMFCVLRARVGLVTMHNCPLDISVLFSVLTIFRVSHFFSSLETFSLFGNERQKKIKRDVRLDITIDINTDDDENDAFFFDEKEEECAKRAMLRFVLFSARVVSLVVVVVQEEEEGWCWFQR